MRITERKLKSIIRSVIKESMIRHDYDGIAEEVQTFLSNEFGDFDDELNMQISTNADVCNLIDELSNKVLNNDIKIDHAKDLLLDRANDVVDTYYRKNPSAYHPYDRD